MPKKTKASHKKRILIVEDEKPMACALQLKLEHCGFEIHCAYHGEEGLALISEQPFDLILLDLVMPRKDGFAVLRSLQTQKNRIPIIVLTNLGQEEDAQEVIRLGAQEYFVKSDTPIVTIVTEVTRILAQKNKA
jgi:DNA-binding response OmpR family regulator